jgi:hypothetical protein
MGNHSYFESQEGCLLDVDRLKVIMRLKGNNVDRLKVIMRLKGNKYTTDYADNTRTLEEDTLGEFMDGWKIQWYWYDEFVEFLYACADCMKGLTDNPSDNMISMEEEQGCKFWINFHLVNGERVVTVEYPPMTLETMELKRQG